MTQPESCFCRRKWYFKYLPFLLAAVFLLTFSTFKHFPGFSTLDVTHNFRHRRLPILASTRILACKRYVCAWSRSWSVSVSSDISHVLEIESAKHLKCRNWGIKSSGKSGIYGPVITLSEVARHHQRYHYLQRIQPPDSTRIITVLRQEHFYFKSANLNFKKSNFATKPRIE